MELKKEPVFSSANEMSAVVTLGRKKENLRKVMNMEHFLYGPERYPEACLGFFLPEADKFFRGRQK